MISSCEHSKEHPGSVKSREFLEQLIFNCEEELLQEAIKFM
jgi:hypothetical protein